MSEQLPKFLAVHFDGDFLEHAAFVESEQEWAQLTCLVSPGDHWDPVLIPIKTAAAAPWLLDACEKHIQAVDGTVSGMADRKARATPCIRAAVAKAVD